MTARVILSSSVLRIGKQYPLVGLYCVDHLGLIVIALVDLGARVVKHCHGQSHLGPVMDGSAGCQAGPEQMRIDSLAESVKRSLADPTIECVVGKRSAKLVEPESVGRLAATEE